MVSEEVGAKGTRGGVMIRTTSNRTSIFWQWCFTSVRRRGWRRAFFSTSKLSRRINERSGREPGGGDGQTSSVNASPMSLPVQCTHRRSRARQ